MRERREREGNRDIPSGPGMTAVEAMMHAARERGELEEPPSPLHAPPVKLEPLRRFMPPEPDWRAEERERAEAEANERTRRERYDRLMRLIDEEGT